jgi:hypothetical protein
VVAVTGRATAAAKPATSRVIVPLAAAAAAAVVAVTGRATAAAKPATSRASAHMAMAAVAAVQTALATVAAKRATWCATLSCRDHPLRQTALQSQARLTYARSIPGCALRH